MPIWFSSLRHSQFFSHQLAANRCMVIHKSYCHKNTDSEKNRIRHFKWKVIPKGQRSLLVSLLVDLSLGASWVVLWLNKNGHIHLASVRIQVFISNKKIGARWGNAYTDLIGPSVLGEPVEVQKEIGDPNKKMRWNSKNRSANLNRGARLVIQSIFSSFRALQVRNKAESITHGKETIWGLLSSCHYSWCFWAL